MIILSNNGQTQNFYKTIGKYMRICLLNFDNKNFKLLDKTCTYSDDNFKFFHKDFKKNTSNNSFKLEFIKQI